MIPKSTLYQRWRAISQTAREQAAKADSRYKTDEYHTLQASAEVYREGCKLLQSSDGLEDVKAALREQLQSAEDNRILLFADLLDDLENHTTPTAPADITPSDLAVALADGTLNESHRDAITLAYPRLVALTDEQWQTVTAGLKEAAALAEAGDESGAFATFARLASSFDALTALDLMLLLNAAFASVQHDGTGGR